MLALRVSGGVASVQKIGYARIPSKFEDYGVSDH